LFEIERQQLLIIEMARVLTPGGTLIVDFYSANARWIFWPAIFLYRRIMRKRPENDYRVSVRVAHGMIERAGLRVTRQEGIGNFLLIPFLWLPQMLLARIATWMGKHFVWLSEQFSIVATKP
jgi:ubiquinone/menaquinone biosynthesis C-methylase UbiE